VRRLTRAAFILLIAAVASTPVDSATSSHAPPAAAQTLLPDLPVAGALDLYSTGDYDGALKLLPGARIRAKEFIDKANAWIDAAPADADRSRRRVVATTFAIDLMSQNLGLRDSRRPDADKSAFKGDSSLAPMFFPSAIAAIVPWALDAMSKTSPRASIDSAWWPAALGLLQQGSFWTRTGNELPRARVRAPSSRWRLIGTLVEISDRVDPPRMESRRDDVLFLEPNGAAALKHASEAIVWLDALRNDPQLAPEIDLRAGYLEMRRRHWTEAMLRFERASLHTTDQFILATASYFEGWTHEQNRRTADAIQAYRRAHEYAPAMRNVSTLLAAQLYATGARDEAYSILERGLASNPPEDLLLMLERGDARFLPQYLTELRRALR
jgi:tetratricopeptide (TPR) repeat protein